MTVKRDREEFVQKCEALIVKFGGEKQDGLNDWKITTRFGVMGLTVREHKARDTGPGVVFTRFDDPTAAHDSTACNPHSGKWNHHYFKGWTTKSALEDFARQLKGVLPVTSHIVSDEDKKTLGDVASRLADDFCRRINGEAPKLETPTMPYREQFVLEEVIKILQERV